MEVIHKPNNGNDLHHRKIKLRLSKTLHAKKINRNNQHQENRYPERRRYRTIPILDSNSRSYDLKR